MTLVYEIVPTLDRRGKAMLPNEYQPAATYCDGSLAFLELWKHCEGPMASWKVSRLFQMRDDHRY